MIETTVAKVLAHVELVKRGVRSAAHMTVRNDECDQVALTIAGYGLMARVTQCGKHHVDIVLFAHRHLEAVIRQIDAAPEPLRAWAYGKLFGYSEDAIGDFIKREAES